MSTCSSRLLVIVALACIGCSSNNPSKPQSIASATPHTAAIPDPPPPPVAAKPDSNPAGPGDQARNERYPPAQQPNGQSLDELLLFFPTKYPDGNWKPDGLEFEDAWFSARNGTRLHGWFCPCDHARAVVLYAHGNAGNLSHRSPRMKYLQKNLRVAALIFDYRGYGRSEGTPTVAEILQDARAARKFLAGRAGIEESQVVLLGDSLGGAVVVDLAAQEGARGLILENTFSSLEDVATYHYPKLAWLVPAGKLDSASRIAKYKGPLLQSHGDADGTIPYALGLKLFGAAPGAKQFVRIRGGDHNDSPSGEYLRQLNRFIGDLPGR